MAMAMVTLIGENKILWLWFIVFVFHLNGRSYWPSKDHRNTKNNDECDLSMSEYNQTPKTPNSLFWLNVLVLLILSIYVIFPPDNIQPCKNFRTCQTSDLIDFTVLQIYFLNPLSPITNVSNVTY